MDRLCRHMRFFDVICIQVMIAIILRWIIGCDYNGSMHRVWMTYIYGIFTVQILQHMFRRRIIRIQRKIRAFLQIPFGPYPQMLVPLTPIAGLRISALSRYRHSIPDFWRKPPAMPSALAIRCVRRKPGAATVVQCANGSRCQKRSAVVWHGTAPYSGHHIVTPDDRQKKIFSFSIYCLRYRHCGGQNNYSRVAAGFVACIVHFQSVAGGAINKCRMF